MDYGKRKLNNELIFKNFLNLRVAHMDEQFRLLLSKVVYPYEYMTSWEKFAKTNSPPRKRFIAILTYAVLTTKSIHARIESGRNLAFVT